MNKLEEIQANIRYHKQNMDDYFARYKEYPFYPDAKMEMLIALLPVVEAAAKLKPYDFYDSESDCCIGCAGIALEHNSIDRTVTFDHQEDCEVEELFTALAALQQEDGAS